MRISDMTVYLDHPVHALETHTVNIDITGTNMHTGDRFALELSPESARRLADSILDLLGRPRQLCGTITTVALDAATPHVVTRLDDGQEVVIPFTYDAAATLRFVVGDPLDVTVESPVER